jgi:hypothetical protein
LNLRPELLVIADEDYLLQRWQQRSEHMRLQHLPGFLAYKDLGRQSAEHLEIAGEACCSHSDNVRRPETPQIRLIPDSVPGSLGIHVVRENRLRAEMGVRSVLLHPVLIECFAFRGCHHIDMDACKLFHRTGRGSTLLAAP